MPQMGSRAASTNAVRLESSLVEAEALAEQLEVTAEPCRRRLEERLIERPSMDQLECESANALVIQRDAFRRALPFAGLGKT
eukprot:10593118-Heterocapsa_arctica.AAC.1